MEKETKKTMLTQSQLLEMGWTKSMINKLLPEPQLKNNPLYKCASPMKLWDNELVESVMQTNQFTELLNKAEKRRAKNQEIFQKKEDNLIRKMNNILEDVKIVILPKETLIKETLKHKKEWTGEEFNEYEVDNSTLERWIVNFIRHELVEYDETVYSLHGKVGKDNAYFTFKEGILNKISEVYPEYADECKKQIEFLKIQQIEAEYMG